VAAKATHFATARALLKVNAAQLPKDNKRLPKIVRVAPKALTSSVVTTDFFGFDTSDDHYKLTVCGAIACWACIAAEQASRRGSENPEPESGAVRIDDDRASIIEGHRT
jgi:hypothetical protein